MSQPSTIAEEHALHPGDLDHRLAAAMPRLARLARLRGVPADAVDDVVQQTLFEAWRVQHRLRNPANLDAWLDGICRNLCRRYRRAEGDDQTTSLSTLAQEDGLPVELTDADTLDLDAALDAEDRARLLDRALGHLPVATRGAVEACYLADLPAGEAALRLGLTVNALEVRLHRARQQLRQLLNGPLREEAASLGILPPGEESAGWRETREWCGLCGNRRLRGILVPQPDGSTRLRMRCPGCSPRYEIDIECSRGLRELNGLSSFKPAVRHYRAACADYYTRLRESGWRRCPICGNEAHMRAVHPDDADGSATGGWYALIECLCSESLSAAWATVAVWSHPDSAAQGTHWLDTHPRSRIEPDRLTSYAGQPAVRTRFLDVATGRAATIFSTPDIPRLLAFIEE